VTSGSLIENKHYIFAPTGRIAVRTERNDTTVDTRYFHTDGLGSITAVTNEAGQIVKRFAFDAWGKRLDPSTNGVITSSTSGKFTRGFTDHEQLDDLGLIHMNGRIYDPVLGRFLSADPNVDGVSDAQGYNRYSYVGNNPMGATDPTGFFSLKDGLKIVAIVVVGIVTAGAAIYAVAALAGSSIGFGAAISMVATASFGGPLSAMVAGAGLGFGSSFTASLLNGGSIGDAFKAGVIGGIVGGVTGGLTYGIGSMSGELGSLGTPLAHGVVEGGLSEAMGGQFRHGFYAGFTASAAGGAIGKIPGKSAVAVAERVSAAAVVGGTASALGGGKFANGAVSGAFVRLFNEEALAHRGYRVILADTYDEGGNGPGSPANGRDFGGRAYATQDAVEDTIVIPVDSVKGAIANERHET
jgi:RHS repeat-associated protein